MQLLKSCAFFLVVLSACTNEFKEKVDQVRLKTVHIINVGRFTVADTSLLTAIGERDTITEKELSMAELVKLMPLQFDSAISVQNIKNYASYNQVVNELVARNQLKAYHIIADTVVPKVAISRSILFDRVSTAMLAQAKEETMASQKAVYKDRTFPIEEIQDTFKTKNAYNVFYVISKGKLPRTITTSLQTRIPVNNVPFVKRRFKICGNASTWQYNNHRVFSECTAFAISEDLIVTAGHCMNASNYKNFYLMLGFSTEPQDNILIDSHDVYTPVEFIDGFADTERGLDFAVVRVNKKIPKSKIFTCSNNSVIDSADKLYMIGHPLGTSTKISLDGDLSDNTNPNYFVVSIDAFAGNSGSPVVGEKDNEVKGILIAGNADFIASDTCSEFVFCNQNARCIGERVFRIANLLQRTKVQARLNRTPLAAAK